MLQIIRSNIYNEHSFRTPFENLIKAFMPKQYELIHEPQSAKGQGKVRPDFKLFKLGDSFKSLQGFIECKNYKENLDKLIKGKQIDKYLAVSPNILLTDYNRFILLSFEKVIADITLFPYGLEKGLFKLEKSEEVELFNRFNILLSDFFNASNANITSKDELVRVLSTQSFYLSTKIYQSDENKLLNTQFQESFEKAFATFSSLEHSNFSKLEFCDILAQSVVYGIFVAYIENENLDVEKLPVSAFIQLLPRHFLTLQEFVYYSLPSFHLPANIQYALENIQKTIALIDKSSIAKSFNTELENICIYLYEDFLKAYDALRATQNRKEGGVFYTPPAVVNMICSSLDELTKEKFNKSKGLASEGVKVLDFACGTGSFLARVFELILAKESEVFAKEAIINKCLKEIYGFEISFVPYIVAHLKLSYLLKNKGFELLGDENALQVFLTNTLDLDSQTKFELSIPFDTLKGQRTKALNIKIQ